MIQDVPTTAGTLATIARVTLRRLRAGRAPWVLVAIAAAPVLFAAATRGHSSAEASFVIELLLLGIVPALLVASSIGEELERRTATYLWARPIARWTVLVGKLLALAPIAAALVALSWLATAAVATGKPPDGASTIGLASGAVALALVSAGIATLAPKHGLALAIAYVMFIDLPIGELPLSLSALSITHQVSTLAHAGGVAAAPLATMVALGGAWLAIGLWRVRRLEV